MTVSLDDAVMDRVKDVCGASTMTTGWVVVAATADGASTGAPTGFVVIRNEGLSDVTQLGLLHSAVNSVTHDQMFPPRNPRPRRRPPAGDSPLGEPGPNEPPF